MGKVKEKLGNIKNSIKNFNYKEYANTNKLFITFIIVNLVNGMLLRFFTVHNYFAIKLVIYKFISKDINLQPLRKW